jgi:hypothetical protein
VLAVTESREHRTAQVLWDLCGTTYDAPHRHRLIAERMRRWNGDELFDFFADLLAAFELLGNERPDVVLPFLGHLLNQADAGQSW